MLHHFVMPYPDEIWYSVLCRYHVRTGNSTSKTTMRQLFGEKMDGQIGTFLPNNTIYQIAIQLPQNVLNIDDIVMNHTLYKYAFRFQSLEEKNKCMKEAKRGKISFNPLQGMNKNQAMLKWCPLCKKEDEEKYGEAYWHVTHQIPYVTMCSKHKCNLIEIPFSHPNERNNNFILLTNDMKGETLFNMSQKEKMFNETLIKYQTLPYYLGPTEGYNNIVTGMINNGFGKIRSNRGHVLDFDKFFESMKETYSKEFLQLIYGTDELGNQIPTQIKTWLLKSPERYAAVTAMINQPAEITFGKPIKNIVEEKLKEISLNNEYISKAETARRIGITSKELESLSKYLGIKKFWKEKRYGETKKNDHIHIILPEGKKEIFQKYIESKRYSGFSELFLKCVEKEIAADPEYYNNKK